MEAGPAGGGQQRPAAAEGRKEGNKQRAVRGGPLRARPGGEGEAVGPASPVVDADVALLDLVDGREEGGGEETEGKRRDGAQLGHARRSVAAAAAALPGGAARSAAPARRRPDVITARPPLPPRRRPARGRWRSGSRGSASSRPALAR